VRQSNAPRRTRLTPLDRPTFAPRPYADAGTPNQQPAFRFRKEFAIRIRHLRSARSRARAGSRTLPHLNFIRFEPAALPVCSARGGVRTRPSAPFQRADTFARMPKPTAYIETTIPNFYYDLRDSEAVTSRRTWTREWWAFAHQHYQLVTSEDVLLELSAGTSDLVPLRLELLRPLEVLPVTSEVKAIAQTYVQHKLMPARPGGDAVHLALASKFNCDLIVTWNCRHLANANKFTHVGQINRLLGLPVPRIVTPLDLLRRD
jgi:hypothetical protein